MRAKRLSAAVLGGVFLTASGAMAQTGPEVLMNDWRGAKHAEAEVSSEFYGRTNLDGGRTTSFNRTQSEGRVALADLELRPAAGFEYTRIGLSQGLSLPEHLDDLSVGVGTPLAGGDGPAGAWYEKWFVALTAAAGYAGDNAFGDSNALYARSSLLAGFRRPSGEVLVFDMTYDGNRDLFPDVPIPSIEYAGRLDDHLDYVAGFPLAALTWWPMGREQGTNVYLEYDFPTTLTAKATYAVTREFDTFLRYSDGTDAFHESDQPEDRRLFYEQKQVEVGIAVSPDWGETGGRVTIETAVGYSFDRRFSRGFDVRNLTTVTDVGDQFYVRAGVNFGF
jgi:hypothetical protein